MTSNRPVEEWGKLVQDAATAILDRFLHHAEIIAMTGRSYRLTVVPDARLLITLDTDSVMFVAATRLATVRIPSFPSLNPSPQ